MTRFDRSDRKQPPPTNHCFFFLTRAFTVWANRLAIIGVKKWPEGMKQQDKAVFAKALSEYKEIDIAERRDLLAVPTKVVIGGGLAVQGDIIKNGARRARTTFLGPCESTLLVGLQTCPSLMAWEGGACGPIGLALCCS